MGEHEELAALLIADAECLEVDQPDLMSLTNHQLRRAAALLREARPQPVPVAERPWERPGWCADWGWCWVFVKGQWLRDYPQNHRDAVCLPHWAIPQPPQGGEVEA